MKKRSVVIDPHGYGGGKACWRPGQLRPFYADGAQVQAAMYANHAAVCGCGTFGCVFIENVSCTVPVRMAA